jgi:hypothetical protein
MNINAHEEAEQIGNELLQKFGYIAVEGPPAEKGEVLEGNLMINSLGIWFKHPVVIIGESTLEEYNEQRAYCGLPPMPEQPWLHFYRVTAE